MVKVNGDDRGGDSDVCEFRFADLRHSGNLTLIVTLNGGARGGCGTAYIVDRKLSGFEARQSPSSGSDADELDDVIQNVAGDGQLYLVFDDQLTDYQGAFCSSSWPVIYDWDGSNYTNLSGQPKFRPFYERQIKSLQQVEQEGYRNNPLFDPICERADIQKIQRFLGAPPDTGIADAIKWADSREFYKRAFAAGVLADIGTPEAIGYLHTLANDSDPRVVVSAQEDLQLIARNGRPTPALTLDYIEDEQRLQMPWWLVRPPPGNIHAPDQKWWARDGYPSKALCDAELDNAGDYAKCIPAPAF